MKTRDKLIFVGLILLLMLIHRYLFRASIGNEGFFDESSDYTTLKQRLITELGPYCKTASFVREQLKTMTSLTGGASDDATLNQTYKSVYSCSDSLASSRRSCAVLLGKGPNLSMTYVSCDTYTQLPEWSNDGSVPLALMKIKDDLPERIVRESEWFAAIIDKLKSSIAAGENPSLTPPSKEEIDKIAEDSKKDGFTGTCSVEAAKMKKAREDSESCSIPDTISEIARVNRLLDSPQLKQAMAGMDGLLNSMLKVQSDLEKAKNGTLYSWQQDGPAKSFPEFKGGDRSQSLVFSLQQNR
jgi:hypothetical protein